MHVFNLYSFPELLKYISWNHRALSQNHKHKTKSSCDIQRTSDACQNKEIYSKPVYLNNAFRSYTQLNIINTTEHSLDHSVQIYTSNMKTFWIKK